MTARTDRETGRGSPAPNGPATLVLVVVCTAILLDALDLSITQVALPDIRHGLDLPTAALQWVVNAYVLTYGGFLLLGGRAADLLGHRRVFLCGLLVFGVMSLVAGLAPSAGVLVVARAVQGVGAALTVPASVAIIATTFAEGQERNRALGFFSAAAAAGFSAGLVLGGVLTDLIDWRWIFFVKVPIVLVTLLLAYRVVVHREAPARRGRSFDLPGAVLVTAGLLLLVFVITQAADRSVALPVVVVTAVLAAGLLAGFVGNERRSGDPLLPLSIFRMRTLRYADLASLTVLAAPFGYSFVTTVYTQEVRGYSPLQTGLALLPSAVLSALVSRYAAPALIQRCGLRFTAVLGLLLVGAGFLLFLWTGTGTSYVAVPLPSSLVCFGLGMGLAYPVFTVGGVTGVDDERQGLAAGIQQTALQVGGGIGLALVSSGVVANLGEASDPASYVHALHTGVLVGAAIPLLGALTAFLGLKDPAGSPRAIDT